jgi:hypothetical protein
MLSENRRSMTDHSTTSQGFKRFLPRIGSPAYHVMLACVAIFILGPLGGISAAFMNFSIGFFIGGQVLAGILGSDHPPLKRAAQGRNFSGLSGCGKLRLLWQVASYDRIAQWCRLCPFGSMVLRHRLLNWLSAVGRGCGRRYYPV